MRRHKESVSPTTPGPGHAAPAQPTTFTVRGLSMAGFHRLAVWHWEGTAASVPVICVHGLTRQARDFDFLARLLTEAGQSAYCPDLVGRVRSEWLRDPQHYNLLQYTADINAVLARIGCEQVDCQRSVAALKRRAAALGFQINPTSAAA